MFTQMSLFWLYVGAHVGRLRKNEEGSVVETVIITAVFAALALAIGVIIVAKITAKAQSINLN
jgi:hypothetical protein